MAVFKFIIQCLLLVSNVFVILAFFDDRDNTDDLCERLSFLESRCNSIVQPVIIRETTTKVSFLKPTVTVCWWPWCKCANVKTYD